MHNKIPSTAMRIDEVYPYTIQSAVPVPTFKLGLEYLSQGRVKILQSDDSSISSQVEGDSGSYQQRIYLEKGSLVTKCSCSSPERPLCRHCLAVMLEFHRLAMGRELRARQDKPFLAKPLLHEENRGTTIGFKLRQITIFMDWLQLAVKAVQSDQDLPEAPDLEPGELRTWVQALQRFQDRFQQTEEERAALVSDLMAHKRQLETYEQEAKKLHEVCEGLRHDLASSRAMLVQIAKERDQVGRQLKSMIDDFIVKKRMEIEGLTMSLQQISVALGELTPVQSPQLIETTN